MGSQISSHLRQRILGCEVEKPVYGMAIWVRFFQQLRSLGGPRYYTLSLMLKPLTL